jgi:acyl-coenzyme A synthetase/AMP-(fatty) acid ligase
LTLNPAIRALLAGGAIVFPESLSLDHFIEAVERHGVTQTTMSPAYLRDLVERAPPGGFHFPSLAQLQLAGSKVPPDVMEAALARVTRNLVVAYGAAEVGLLALADAELMRSAPESVGRLAPGVEAEAVGEQGELRFRRPGMPREYIGNPGASAQAFRDGWFHPGDTGSIGAGGLLVLRGRTDDKLNLDGMKIDPEPIERALQSHPAVIEAAAFAAALDGGRPALFAAAVLRGPADEKALIAHVRARVGPMYAPARIFFAKDLPRNDRGKLQRSDLAQRVGRRPRA